MKVIFEFQLPEETDDYNTYRRAGNYLIAVDDFSNHLRSVLNHNLDMDKLSKTKLNITLAVYEDIRTKWYEILSDNGVNE